MPLRKWTKRSDEVLFRNPWWTYRKDHFTTGGGHEGEYHVVHTNGSSLVVPVLNDGRLVLVNQYRFLCDRESLEFPCGGLKDGQTHDQTAQQELQEEAGFMARSWMVAGEFNPFNGLTDEMCRVYIARDLHPVPALPDATEEFEIVHLTFDELEARIVSGVVWDGMTMAAWSLAKNHL